MIEQFHHVIGAVRGGGTFEYFYSERAYEAVFRRVKQGFNGNSTSHTQQYPLSFSPSLLRHLHSSLEKYCSGIRSERRN